MKLTGTGLRTACWVGVSVFALVTAAVNPVSAQGALAVVEQVGTSNEAIVLQGSLIDGCIGCVLYLEQMGDENISYLTQGGNDHDFRAIQNGDFNHIETLQDGSGHSVDIEQLNSDNVFIFYQYGDERAFSITQPGDGYVEMTQY